MGDVRQRTVWTLPSVSRASGSINIAITMLDPSSMHDMMIAAVASSLRVLRIRPIGRMRIVARVAPYERHHGHAGFETGEPQRQLGKEHAGTPRSRRRGSAPPSCVDVPVAAVTELYQCRIRFRMDHQIRQPADDHDQH